MIQVAARAAEISAGYDGPLAFKSFDPDVIGFLREAGSPRPLGLVAEASYEDPYFAALSPAQVEVVLGELSKILTHYDFSSISKQADQIPVVK